MLSHKRLIYITTIAAVTIFAIAAAVAVARVDISPRIVAATAIALTTPTITPTTSVAQINGMRSRPQFVVIVVCRKLQQLKLQCLILLVRRQRHWFIIVMMMIMIAIVVIHRRCCVIAVIAVYAIPPALANVDFEFFCDPDVVEDVIAVAAQDFHRLVGNTGRVAVLVTV